jgi:glycosyltransferase involved in cell wall biosynthesis
LGLKLALLPAAWLSKMQALSHVETEVAVSQHDLRNLQTWYWPLRRKFRQIYHSRIRESSAPPRNPRRRKVILCAGTIGPRKGQTFLVEAFCRLAPEFRDWQLVLVGRDGDATMTRRIYQLIAEHHLENQIQVLGPRSDEELRVWLTQSAIFAMPSLYEGLGLSLQEALFYGCACVGTRCGGVTDLIQDGDNGLLVPPAEVAPLADALEKLMSDPVLREKFSTRGPQSVLEKGMTADRMVQHYEQLYEEVLSQGT